MASGSLSEPMSRDALMQRFDTAYANEGFVRLQDQPAEPAAAANTHHCRIGGLTVDRPRPRLVVTAAVDNLLKGAAS